MCSTWIAWRQLDEMLGGGRAHQVKVTHAGLSRLHCALNRSLIVAIQSEIRPQCCPEKPHTANDNTAAIESVREGLSGRHRQRELSAMMTLVSAKALAFIYDGF
jgi:hypothetical protein